MSMSCKARTSSRRLADCTTVLSHSRSMMHCHILIRTGHWLTLILEPRYHYYALKTRAEEDSITSPKTNWRALLSGKKEARDVGAQNGEHDPTKDHTEANFARKESRIEISDQEWTNASRAFRSAGAGAAFYLVSQSLSSSHHRSLVEISARHQVRGADMQ